LAAENAEQAIVSLPTIVTPPPAAPSVPVLQSSIPTTQNPGTGSFASGLATLQVPMIAFPSSYEISPGQTLTISGGGFLKSNTLEFGSAYTLSAPSSDGTTIKVTIPENAPLGKYSLKIKNTNGESEYGKPMVIKDPTTPDPTITSVSPTSGKYGTMVTITGTGFTKTGNDIMGALNITDIPSSDGRTLTFAVTPLPEIFGSTSTANWTNTTFTTWLMHFIVVNANGLSSATAPGTFNFSR
jgi:hypothetical protein